VTFVFLSASVVLAVMIVALMLSNMRFSGEVRELKDKLRELEAGNSELVSRVGLACDQLTEADREMKTIRSELKAEIEASGKH